VLIGDAVTTTVVIFGDDFTSCDGAAAWVIEAMRKQLSGVATRETNGCDIGFAALNKSAQAVVPRATNEM
jgi:hypothetical protein